MIHSNERCVASKVINGKEYTIALYVDNNKVSHVDPKVMTSVIDLMKEHFGDLIIHRGNNQNFLAMSISINKEMNIKIEMIDQLMEAVNMCELHEGKTVN